MTDWGVTPSGFAKKTVTDILAEIRESQLANIDPALNLLATSVLGQLNGIVADKLREEWDVSESVYRSQFPDSASGDALDGVASITGTTRLAPTKSDLTVTCTGTPTTVLAIGRVVSTGAGDRFASTEEKTIAAADVWAASTEYDLGDFVANDSNIYVCVLAGESAGSGGPTGTGDDIVDNEARWDFVGDGIGYVNVSFESEQLGAIPAVAGALDTEEGSGAIETPVSGWDDAQNLEDADVGREIETDAAFRIRREQLLRVTGAASLEAIRARVRDLEDVLQVFVFENTDIITDPVSGLPPKSFEAVVSGGLDQDIADRVWLVKPAGIETFGTVTVPVEDSQGFSHDILFSRPDEIEIYVDVTVDIDAATYPVDGDDQVKAALVVEGGTLNIGDDVIALQFKCAPLAIGGVIDVTIFKIDTVFPPVNTANIVIAFRELATFDTSRIRVFHA